MADITIKLDGIDGAISALSRMGKGAPAAAGAGVETVAGYFRDALVRYAQMGHPDHPNVISGRLSGNMTYVMVGDASAQVGSTAPYAPYVEYGHMSRSWGSNTWHNVPAYPFFKSAVTEVFDTGAAQQVFISAVEGALGI